jgi:hypothetical protein
MIGLCERFHKLPSEIEAEDSSFLRYLELIRLGSPVEDEGVE